MLKLAANLRWLFQEWPIAERFAVAASTGFKGVEMPVPYAIPARDLAQTLNNTGLTMVQIATPADWVHGVLGLAAIPGRSSEFMDGVHMAIEYAAQIGRPKIHVLLGERPASLEPQQVMDLLVSNLARAAEAAAVEGITLTMEPVCRSRNANWALHRLNDAQEVIRAVGRDNLKLVFDTFHVGMEEGALIDCLVTSYAEIAVIQIGNPPDRHEPGVGDFDLLGLLNKAAGLEWGDWISCEYIPSRGTLDSLDWAAPYGICSTPQAQAWLRNASTSASARPIGSWREMSRRAE